MQSPVLKVTEVNYRQERLGGSLPEYIQRQTCLHKRLVKMFLAKKLFLVHSGCSISRLV